MLAWLAVIFFISAFVTLNMDLGRRKLEKYQANTTKQTFERMIVTVHATNCDVVSSLCKCQYQNRLFLLLNSTQGQNRAVHCTGT